MITEPIRAGEHIIAEANGTISRERIVVASGAGALPAGQVLGKITVGGKYAAYDPAATDGTETAAGILYDAVDATSADAPGVISARHTEVKEALLTGLDAAAKADLAPAQIIFR